ncbi:unnamed protein product [Phytophthora lilii]|uniref:Unnamed protein product n=1 Tax=Phytophthora lilii TaxID=2077276 RepID=A0A9W6TLS3_9STRA|nr:unnamed protein product [Phytophthora lilii]
MRYSTTVGAEHPAPRSEQSKRRWTNHVVQELVRPWRWLQSDTSHVGRSQSKRGSCVPVPPTEGDALTRVFPIIHELNVGGEVIGFSQELYARFPGARVAPSVTCPHYTVFIRACLASPVDDGPNHVVTHHWDITTGILSHTTWSDPATQHRRSPKEQMQRAPT